MTARKTKSKSSVKKSLPPLDYQGVCDIYDSPIGDYYSAKIDPAEWQAEDFALIVLCDVDGEVHDNDRVVVRPNIQPQPGDMCALVIRGKSQLARLFPGPTTDQLRLAAVNKDWPDMIFPRSQIKLLGVVQAVDHGIGHIEVWSRDYGKEQTEKLED